MKKLFDFIVDKRIWLFFATLLASVLCAILMPFVTVNRDMTQYLPKNSNMKKGLDIILREFPAEEEDHEFKLMFQDISAEEKKEINAFLNLYTGVEKAQSGEGEDFEKDGYTLFIVTCVSHKADQTEKLMTKIVSALEKEYTVYSFYAGTKDKLMLQLIPIALVLVVVILFLVCASFFEPVLILSTIALSVLLNMGTNAFMPSVSYITYSLSSVLQIILSIDYSIILIRRYLQERQHPENATNAQAMKSALTRSFGSISSSAFTTLVGLLALVFMSFTIGADIGLVLGKGVLFSMICTFTFLPTAILWCDKLLHKTDKRALFSALKRKIKEGKKNA